MSAFHDDNNGTFISRYNAFSQCQAAWLLLLATTSCSLHLQQVRRDPERVVPQLPLTVLPTPKTNFPKMYFPSRCEQKLT